MSVQARVSQPCFNSGSPLCECIQALGYVTEVAATASAAPDVRALLLAAVLAEVLLPAVKMAHLQPSQRGVLRNAVAAAAPSVLDLAMRCLPELLLVRLSVMMRCRELVLGYNLLSHRYLNVLQHLLRLHRRRDTAWPLRHK